MRTKMNLIFYESLLSLFEMRIEKVIRKLWEEYKRYVSSVHVAGRVFKKYRRICGYASALKLCQFMCHSFFTSFANAVLSPVGVDLIALWIFH